MQPRAGTGPPPSASWVMGRSARWHDPDVQAELAMYELAEGHAPLTGLASTAVPIGSLPTGSSFPYLPLRLITLVVRLVLRAARSAPYR